MLPGKLIHYRDKSRERLFLIQLRGRLLRRKSPSIVATIGSTATRILDLPNGIGCLPTHCLQHLQCMSHLFGLLRVGLHDFFPNMCVIGLGCSSCARSKAPKQLRNKPGRSFHKLHDACCCLRTTRFCRLLALLCPVFLAQACVAV